MEHVAAPVLEDGMDNRSTVEVQTGLHKLAENRSIKGHHLTANAPLHFCLLQLRMANQRKLIIVYFPFFLPLIFFLNIFS